MSTKLCRREFLNDDHGLAAVHVCADLYGHVPVIDAAVEVSDCSRTVSLDFTASTEAQRLERIAKVDRLLANLYALREWLEQARIEEPAASTPET